MNKKTREAIAERSGNVCEFCHGARATQIHHIRHRSQSGTDEMQNLIHLCDLCHWRAHNIPGIISQYRDMRTLIEKRGKR
jgi:hypothetical protein